MVDEQIDSHVFSSIGCLRRSPGAYVCWHTMRLADVVWPRAVSGEDLQRTDEDGTWTVCLFAISEDRLHYVSPKAID